MAARPRGASPQGLHVAQLAQAVVHGGYEGRQLLGNGLRGFGAGCAFQVLGLAARGGTVLDLGGGLNHGDAAVAVADEMAQQGAQAGRVERGKPLLVHPGVKWRALGLRAGGDCSSSRGLWRRFLRCGLGATARAPGLATVVFKQRLGQVGVHACLKGGLDVNCSFLGRQQCDLGR